MDRCAPQFVSSQSVDPNERKRRERDLEKIVVGHTLLVYH